ncbi:cytochrome P450 [Halieaceae bacterium]|nr:cytochrome P450 [Halieaceae bacterium]
MSQCPYANLLDPDTYVNGMPYEALKEIRDVGPVVWMEDPVYGVPFWAITRKKELDFVSKNPKLFSSAEGTPFPMEPLPGREGNHHHFVIGMDPPKHQKYRRIMRDAFTPKAVESYRPRFRKYAKKIIDAVVSKGECEFVEEVAAELPLIAIMELAGVPMEDRKLFFEWTNTMSFADDPDMATGPEDGIMASFKMLEYGKKMAAEQRDAPKDDLVGALLKGRVDGEPISDEDLSWMFLLTVVGGNESTRTSTAHGMRLLMEHPDQLQHLIDHPEDIPAAIEEMVRYNTAFIAMRRTAMEDIELGGQLIKKGDKVVMHYHMINHDEDEFGEDAMEFNIHRAIDSDISNRLRSFGIGQHFCIGSHLARMELQVIFEEMLPRLRNPKFAGPVKYMRSSFINTIKSMPITFDPEQSAA